MAQGANRKKRGTEFCLYASQRPLRSSPLRSARSSGGPRVRARFGIDFSPPFSATVLQFFRQTARTRKPFYPPRDERVAAPLNYPETIPGEEVTGVLCVSIGRRTLRIRIRIAGERAAKQRDPFGLINTQATHRNCFATLFLCRQGGSFRDDRLISDFMPRLRAHRATPASPLRRTLRDPRPSLQRSHENHRPREIRGERSIWYLNKRTCTLALSRHCTGQVPASFRQTRHPSCDIYRHREVNYPNRAS